MCDDNKVCCNQLEAEAIHSNQQLLEFDVRSRNVRWPEYVMPLQPRASAVYLQRQFNLVSNYREPIGEHNRREVLVCHDMMGNYLEDRHYHSSQKYDDYRFYHWSGIDYFCYFSHKYITIPPCGWINAAHKHGVRVLGTFITEGNSGSSLLHEILRTEEMMISVVAAMVKLCKHYGFEGWLVNIECKVNETAMELLFDFLQRLRTEIEKEVDYGIVFWYDSVIETGELLWQNEINAKNVRFFRSANAMLINYIWNDRSLEMTRESCSRERAPCQRAFFGIDVFGRGQVAKFHSKQTLARIVQKRFSTGIFAPGWTYETLQQFGYNIKQPLGDDAVNEAFLQRNEKFWWSLWDHLATHPYKLLPFYTDFCLGSGKQSYVCGLPKLPEAVIDVDGDGDGDGDGTSNGNGNGIISFEKKEQTSPETKNVGRFFNLSRQSLQPSVPLHELAERCYDDAFNGGSCLRILQYDNTFRLFATDFQAPRGGVVCAYAYKLHPNDGELDCILRFCTGNNARDCYLFLGDYYDTVRLERGRCYISPFKPKYNELLTGLLESTQIPKDMAFSDLEANGWRVRYYVAAFDGAIQIKDIGVLYRKANGARDTAYLGAIYLNTFDINLYDFPLDTNIALIQVYDGYLLN